MVEVETILTAVGKILCLVIYGLVINICYLLKWLPLLRLAPDPLLLVGLGDLAATWKSDSHVSKASNIDDLLVTSLLQYI